MTQWTKIFPKDAKLNMRFSAPVFFNDGKNMFLASGKPLKKYHIDCLERWSIPYLLTAGHEIDEEEAKAEQSLLDIEEASEVEEINDIEELS